jgi:hypothetical protein
MYFRYGVRQQNISYDYIQSNTTNILENLLQCLMQPGTQKQIFKSLKSYITYNRKHIKYHNDNKPELCWEDHFDTSEYYEKKKLEDEFFTEESLKLIGGGVQPDINMNFFSAITDYLKTMYGTQNNICVMCNKTTSLMLSGCPKCFMKKYKTLTKVRYDINDIVDKYEIDKPLEIIRSLDDLINDNKCAISDDKVLQLYLINQKVKQNVLLKLAILCIKYKYLNHKVPDGYKHYFKEYYPDQTERIGINYNLYFLCLFVDNNFGEKYGITIFNDEETLFDRRYDFSGSIGDNHFMIEIDDKSHDSDYGKENDKLKNEYCYRSGKQLFRVDIRDRYIVDNRYKYFKEQYDKFEREFSKYVKSLS